MSPDSLSAVSTAEKRKEARCQLELSTTRRRERRLTEADRVNVGELGSESVSSSRELLLVVVVV